MQSVPAMGWTREAQVGKPVRYGIPLSQVTRITIRGYWGETGSERKIMIITLDKKDTPRTSTRV